MAIRPLNSSLPSRLPPPPAAQSEKQGFLEKIRESAQEGRDVFAGPSTTEAKLAELGPGDKLVIGGEFEVKAGVKVETAGDVTIKKSKDGSFVVSLALEGQVSAGAGVRGLAAVATGASFTLANAQEAGQALAQLRSFGLRGADAFKGGLSKLELSPKVGVELEAKVGWGAAGAKLKSELTAGVAWSLEFDDAGTKLVREEILSAEVKGEAKPKLLEVLSDGAVGATAATAKLHAEVTLRSTLDLPEDLGVRDVAKALAFVADLTGLANASLGATREVEIAWERAGQVLGKDAGTKWTVSANRIDLGDAARAAGAALRGDSQGALAALGEDVEISEHSYRDRGLDFEASLKLPGLGFEVRVKNEIRDVDPAV